MDVEVVKALMQSFKEAELTKLSLKCEDFEVKLEKQVNVIESSALVRSTVDGRYRSVNDSVVGKDGVVSNMEAISTVREETTSSVQDNRGREKHLDLGKAIKSPIVGTFYRADSIGGKPLVDVGDYVHKGDIVCIIEAMKLMNEVEAEEEGEVIEILVENEEMVEYNQPLIILR
ncbi:MAG: acetyl-CoA carboxylase biotin carboxyl carrier protein [Cellulosilyticum sp.]|nr:acetyl-CoA carboxylase biotin carboxyl carrier protein [Cellulosilyticum sp.]